MEDTIATTAATTTQTQNTLLTPVIWCILVTETAERFAYFGFRAILVLYFTMELEYTESQAIALFAYTTCLAYLSPIAGALLADGHLGRYSTILYFGCIYILGLAILSTAAWYRESLSLKRFVSFLGLFLVCLGTGGIKPCVSAFGADQVAASAFKYQNGTTAVGVGEPPPPPLFRDDASTVPLQPADGILKIDPPIDPRETGVVDDSYQEKEQVRAFFLYFYFCINVGAVTSIAVIPIVRGRIGFGAAFLLSCVFMVTAVALFFSHRNKYVHQEPGKDGSSLSTTFRLCWWLFRQQLWAHRWVAKTFPIWRPGATPPIRSGQHALIRPNSEEADASDSKDQEKEGITGSAIDANIENGKDTRDSEIINQQLDDAAQALHVLPILAMFPIFWALYDQQGSVWTLQATRMSLNGLQPEQLNLVNPVEIMLFIPLFDRIIYPAMQARGWDIAPLRRMAWGMFLAAAAFFTSGLVESSIQQREEDSLEKMNVFWQLPQITLLAVAEIFLSVTGLEFAYSTSPARLKAFIMAIFLLTTAVGDFFSGVLYSTIFAELNRSTIMHVCAVLMLGNLALFLCVSRWWERRDFHDLRRTASFPGIELEERLVV
jgi:dipeptide/tripeptide permease